LDVVAAQEYVEYEIADVMVVADFHAVEEVEEETLVAVGEESFVDDGHGAAVDIGAAAPNVVHVAAAQSVGTLETPIENGVAVVGKILMKLIALFEEVVAVVVEDMACVA
jgi:hypothetical protein